MEMSHNPYLRSQIPFTQRILFAYSDKEAAAMKSSSACFAGARKKNEKLKNYFDEDDDDELPTASTPASLPDDDYDPLDAFMLVFD